MSLLLNPLFTIATSDNNAEVGAVSFAIDGGADGDTLQSAGITAIMAMVNGTQKEHGIYMRSIDPLRLIGAAASDKGHKWRVTFRDTVTGRLETKTIPTANGTLRLTASDAMNPALSAYTGFKTWLETYATSSAGNAVVLESIVYEG